MDELRKSPKLISELGISPSAKGRAAITGKDDEHVWDYLQLASNDSNKSFNHFPHLTLGIAERHVEAVVTFPHKLETPSKNALKQLGSDGFEAKCMETLTQFETRLKSEPSSIPFMRGVQRRYPSQRAKPFVDALIHFDLRTIRGVTSGPKEQSQWLNALYGAFVDRNSNYQIQIGAAFYYDQCSTIASTKALTLLEESWLACAPLLDVARIQN